MTRKTATYPQTWRMIADAQMKSQAPYKLYGVPPEDVPRIVMGCRKAKYRETHAYYRRVTEASELKYIYHSDDACLELYLVEKRTLPITKEFIRGTI